MTTVRPRPTLLLPLCLAIVYVAWGSTYLAIRVMVRTVPPLLGAGGRFVAAGVLLLAAVALVRGPGAVRVSATELRGAAIVAALVLVGGIGLLTVAEQSVASGVAAVVIATVPLWVVVLRATTGARPTPGELVGTVAGLSGVALLALRHGGEPSSLRGIALLVLAAVLTAAGAFVSPRLTLPRDLLVTSGVEMLVAGAATIALGVVTSELDQLSSAAVDTASLAAFGYLVVVGSVVAYSAFAWLLAHAPLSVTATYAYVNPVVAVLLGWALLSEALTPSMVAALALVFTAVVVVLRSERRAAAHDRRD